MAQEPTAGFVYIVANDTLKSFTVYGVRIIVISTKSFMNLY